MTSFGPRGTEDGRCVECGGWHQLRVDGTVRRHRADEFGTGWWCAGALQPPSHRRPHVSSCPVPVLRREQR